LRAANDNEARLLSASAPWTLVTLRRPAVAIVVALAASTVANVEITGRVVRRPSRGSLAMIVMVQWDHCDDCAE